MGNISNEKKVLAILYKFKEEMLAELRDEINNIKNTEQYLLDQINNIKNTQQYLCNNQQILSNNINNLQANKMFVIDPKQYEEDRAYEIMQKIKKELNPIITNIENDIHTMKYDIKLIHEISNDNKRSVSRLKDKCV